MNRLERLGLDPAAARHFPFEYKTVQQGGKWMDRSYAASILETWPGTWYYLGLYKNPSSACAAAYYINRRGFGYLECDGVQATTVGRKAYVRAVLLAATQ